MKIKTNPIVDVSDIDVVRLVHHGYFISIHTMRTTHHILTNSHTFILVLGVTNRMYIHENYVLEQYCITL